MLIPKWYIFVIHTPRFVELVEEGNKECKIWKMGRDTVALTNSEAVIAHRRPT